VPLYSSVMETVEQPAVKTEWSAAPLE
jgi:hypothetical protein